MAVSHPKKLNGAAPGPQCAMIAALFLFLELVT